MGNYTTKKQKLTKFAYTNHKECAPLTRCNNYKKCPHCFTIWKKKQYTKLTKNLTEKRIKDFKHKYFLTVVSMDKNISVYEKNSNIDLFLNDLINGKRYKSNLFYKSEFVSVKQISKNDLGINPHLHITLLTNRYFKRDKKLKELLNKYNLRIHKQDIYKDKDNSFKTSIKKLINYSLKQNKDTHEIEKQFNLTNSKSYIKKSILFHHKKYEKSQELLYKYIHDKKALINKKYKEDLNIAINLFKTRYSKQKPKGYIRGLKALKNKKAKLTVQKRRKLSALMRECQNLT